MPKGFVIAAPSSGAGKTTVTLALLRALKNIGTSVVSAKSGPDYIDPKFHEAACNAACINLDAWAMDAATVRALAFEHSQGHDVLMVEGAMGLFDGAANGRGSAADLAARLDLPVVLVVDCAKQSQSVAALLKGFQTFRDDIHVAGVVLNRVGSPRHERLLRKAVEPLGLPVLGALPKSDLLRLPERHLGLVQAGEHPDLETFLETAAQICRDHIDLPKLQAIGGDLRSATGTVSGLPEPLGQRVAVARDVAFAFSYPHLMSYWKMRGAELTYFSPLLDEGPDQQADAVFLPGGYPELHAGRLSSADRFRSEMLAAADHGKTIYGECGGYMTLGDGLVDASGTQHRMLGLLPLVTSFKDRKRHLGYRVVQALAGLPWTGALAAHEFHYASVVSQGQAEPLFSTSDAEDTKLADMGLRKGKVMGSFAHVISRFQTASSTTS